MRSSWTRVLLRRWRNDLLPCIIDEITERALRGVGAAFL